ncbi:MAG: hypothetical protein JNL22_02725 [Bacteroidales bacterium]|jgi:hypothetical protein|nr:hypothetical protein [Bacteroidales bacterium]
MKTNYSAFRKNCVSILLLVTITFLTIEIYGQGVSVSETNSPPDPSAMLDVESTTKGFLPPRLTSAQRIAMLTPASGLVVYDTDFNALFVNTGEGWMRVDYGDKWQKDEDNNLTYNLGKVGIGVNYPEAEFEVNGQIKINGGSPGAGKVLTSDAAGTATWQNSQMSILSTSQATGYSPLYVDLNFIVVPATITLSETASIMIHSTRGLGATTTGVTTGLMNLFMCYKNTNGGAITAMGQGIYGLRVPANIRIPFSLSYSTNPLPPGTYEVGLCGTCADPTQWNSNEFSYTTAMAYKLPTATSGFSANVQQTYDGGFSGIRDEARQNPVSSNSSADFRAGYEPEQSPSAISLEERIDLLNKENERIKNQLIEISRAIEKNAQTSDRN